MAQLDPLGILQADLSETAPADLSLEYWGLGELWPWLFISVLFKTL